MNERPAPLTPYQRMRWQKDHCRHDIAGYAVGIANERTERAAYLTADGELTNDEREAAVLPKAEASRLMGELYDGGWFRRELWRIAFLVPASEEYPLTNCTFQGH